MSVEQNKALLRKWIEEGWNKGNLAMDVLARFFSFANSFL